MSREGCNGMRNKVKNKEPSHICFQISSEEQSLDFCGIEKKENWFDGGKYQYLLGKFLPRSSGNRT